MVDGINGVGVRAGADPRFSGDFPGETDSPPRLRAGFGRGTVTAPAAALQTLDRGVRAAAETAPSLEELQAAHRAARAEESNSLEGNKLQGVRNPLEGPEAPSAARHFERERPTPEGQSVSEPSRASAPNRVDAAPSTGPEPRPEPPVPNPAPTGPNALAGQRLNVLA